MFTTFFDIFDKVGIFDDTKDKPSIIHVDGVYSLRCKVFKKQKLSCNLWQAVSIACGRLFVYLSQNS